MSTFASTFAAKSKKNPGSPSQETGVNACVQAIYYVNTISGVRKIQLYS